MVANGSIYCLSFSGSPLPLGSRPDEIGVAVRIDSDSVTTMTRENTMHRKLQWVKIQILGNVPVGTAGCEIEENGADVNLGVEMILLVKEAGSVRTQVPPRPCSQQP